MTHLMTSASDLPPPTLHRVDDEAALLRSAATGDVPAQERLWRRHLDAVHRVCASQLRQHDAEDAVADTFLEAFRVGATFDPTRGTVRAWLLGIAVNQVRRRWRVDRRIASTLARVHVRERRDASTDDHADHVIARADAAGIRHALAQLSDADRLVLVTQAAGDLLPAELAEVLATTPGAAKVRLHRARSRLASLLAAPPH